MGDGSRGFGLLAPEYILHIGPIGSREQRAWLIRQCGLGEVESVLVVAGVVPGGEVPNLEHTLTPHVVGELYPVAYDLLAPTCLVEFI